MISKIFNAKTTVLMITCLILMTFVLRQQTLQDVMMKVCTSCFSFDIVI